MADVSPVAFVEAALGLGLLAMLISYLPTIYGSFSRREVSVSQLAVRAGTPPSAPEMIIRAHRTGFTEQPHENDRRGDGTRRACRKHTNGCSFRFRPIPFRWSQ